MEIWSVLTIFTEDCCCRYSDFSHPVLQKTTETLWIVMLRKWNADAHSRPALRGMD